MIAVVHQYFKLDNQDFTILVQINPLDLSGLELILAPDGKTLKTPRQFDADIYEDLDADGFTPSSALEFNLHLKGIRSTTDK